MVKVLKSTGAVAVYSPVRVAAIIAGAVLLIAGIGFGIGRIGHGGDSSSSSSSAPAAQASDGKTYADGYRQGQTAGRRQAAATTRTDGGAKSSTATKAAYNRGFAAGKASVKPSGASAAPLSPGSFFVKVERGAGGRAVIGPHIELQAGRIYSLCRGGKTVCFRLGTLTPGTPGTRG